MKKLLYLIFIFFLGVGCSSKETRNKKRVIENVDTICNLDTIKDSVNTFPEAYKYTRHYRDSVDREIKAYSYRIYGDSNLLEEGLPDSMKLHNN